MYCSKSPYTPSCNVILPYFQNKIPTNIPLYLFNIPHLTIHQTHIVQDLRHPRLLSPLLLRDPLHQLLLRRCVVLYWLLIVLHSHIRSPQILQDINYTIDSLIDTALKQTFSKTKLSIIYHFTLIINMLQLLIQLYCLLIAPIFQLTLCQMFLT